MKRPFTIVCAGAIVLLMNLPLSAGAAVPGPQSDQGLRWARSRVESDIDMLQRDQHDYDGHRVKAIEAFQDGRNQLDLALAYDRNRGDDSAAAQLASASSALRGQCASDVDLNQVRRDVERVIDVLQRDNSDYGGHRADALALLQQGRQQLVDAIQWDATH
jgi:hypothetical protein